MKILIILMGILTFSVSNSYSKVLASFNDGLVFIEWNQNHSTSWREEKMAKIAATGSKHLTLVVFGCQSTLLSSDVGSCEVQNKNYVYENVRIAQKQGFKVTILPILTTPKWEWRGFFNPTKVNKWFENYTKWLTQIAIKSEELGVIELVIASEISGLYKHEQKWINLAGHIRKHFSGNLIITTNWDHFDFNFWGAVDAIGISAYFPLSLKMEPTKDELVESWQKYKDELIAYSKKHNKPLHFSEIGYQSIRGAAMSPWSAPSDAPTDFEHQATCFEAFSEVWADEKSLVRASIWVADDLGPDKIERSFSILDKPAQRVLEEFFERRNLMSKGN